MKKIYLVSQSYRPGDESSKEAVLFTDYEDKWMAVTHHHAIQGDKYAYLLDLTNPEHKDKVLRMAAGTLNHVAYWAAVMNKADLAKFINIQYVENIRRIIKQKTSWTIGGNQTIHPVIEVVFGELYITFKYSGEELRIKFKEVENT